MKLQEKALLHTLLTRDSNGEHLLRYLPPELADEIQEWPRSRTSDFSKLLSQKGWTESIHFSWFCQSLKTLRPETQQLFLSLLDLKQVTEVCKMLELTPAPPSYSPFLRPFLMDEFKQKVQQGVEVIDQDSLPPSDLNVLLTLEKKQLLNVIDLLGIYDLSADLRQVVDKELFRKIYSALAKEQLRFLHYCLKQPIKWVSPKLGLPAWDGAKKTLQRQLHSRGLIRLGRAFFDENESLKWHLLHHLDIGRAGVIEKIFRQKQDRAFIPYFKNQVLHIVKRYKK